MNESLLVGETIIFSPDKINKYKGLVMGVAIMRFKQTDIYPTSGYSVMVDGEGTIRHIPYWYVLSVVEPDDLYKELVNKAGGDMSVNYPKYEKPIHPKGWAVDEESNDDLGF